MPDDADVTAPAATPRTRREAANPVPQRAMLLAAGLGMRLRPLTETRPKPLVEVAGRTLIDRALDRLEEVGVETVVVNLHHLGHMIQDHLAGRERPEVLYSHEPELLETGGGVAKALSHFGDSPFFVANTDIIWLSGPRNALLRMAAAWDDSRMDGLLLLHPTVIAHGYDGPGDFLIDPAGLLSQRPEREISPYMFTGVQMLHPRLFEGVPDGPFRLRLLYDRAIERQRLFGIVSDGVWFHVGTAEGLAETEAFMQVRYADTNVR